MNPLEVGCAIIRHKGKLLIAQRKPGDSYAGFWEFPGGKKRSSETLEACLVREVQEELGIRVRPVELVLNQLYQYPRGRKIRLYFYLCDYDFGTPVCHDCYAIRWIQPEEMRRFLFLPADIEVINRLIARRHFYFGCR